MRGSKYTLQSSLTRSSHFLVASGFLGCLIGLPAFGQSGCVTFPANYVPFSSIAYVTAPNAAGDLLVVGSLAGGLTAFSNAIQVPPSPNQQYCGQVQLAPQRSYPNVYVPSAAERAGNFSAFAGLLLNPATNQPYPNGVIPASQLGSPYYAWRIAGNSVNITSVQNAASNITQGLPNAGIAQGSIFIVKGAGLGPATISIAAAAFQAATLSNTSVAITVGATTVNALIYYTSAAQVAALLPSNTPTGTGAATVTYNGQTSATFPVTVVANNLGIFTIDSTGGGPGIVTYPDYSLVSPVKAANCGGPNTTCGAANPGDALILWATGLGPVSGSDASGAGLGVAINVPLTLWLGGVAITPSYQGRSGCCIGEDQIVFTIPSNAPTGCAVPLLIQIGAEISNNTLLPVANGSRNCTPTRASLASVGSQQIQQLVAAGGPLASGTLNLWHYSDGGGTFEDDAEFDFLDVTSYAPGSQPFFVSWVDDQPLGTCVTYNKLNSGFSVPITGISFIDAGSSFTLTGPKGNVKLPPGTGQNSQFNGAGTFLVPGTYTVTGTGGASAGAFSATMTIPALSTLVSPANSGTATRANGMPVTWTGGSGNLQIQVSSCTDNSCNNGATAVCSVPASLGTFTIPPYVLESLPAGAFAGLVLSSYSVGSFTATGLAAGTTFAYSNESGFGYGWGSGSFTLK